MYKTYKTNKKKNVTAGYFVRLDLAANLAVHIKTMELSKSMKASAMVEKMDSEPEVTAAASCRANRMILATTEP